MANDISKELVIPVRAELKTGSLEKQLEKELRNAERQAKRFKTLGWDKASQKWSTRANVYRNRAEQYGYIWKELGKKGATFGEQKSNGLSQKIDKSFADKLSGKSASESASAFASKYNAYAKGFEIAKKAVKAYGRALVITSKATVTFGKLMVKSLPFKNIANSIQSVIKKLTYFKGRIMSIATYRIFRSLVMGIAQGFKDGINNAYQWSKAIGGTLASAMDNLATSLLYVRNGFGALAGNMLEDFIPAITTVLDGVVELTTKLSKLYSALTGKDYYYKATKSLKEYQKAKKQTFGFDELNIMSEQENYGEMFEKVATETDNATKSLREMISVGNLGGFGSGIGEMISEWINSIDAVAIGQKLGNKLQSIIDFINGFFASVPWEAMGTKLADGINALIDSIDPASLGTMLTNKLNSVIVFIKGLVEKFNWEGAGTWLGRVVANWFGTIKWDDLTNAIGSAINGLVEFGIKFFEEKPWSGVGKRIAEVINTLVKEKISWENVGTLINNAITTLLETAIDFIINVDWVDVGNSIYDALSQIEWETIFTDLKTLMWEAAKAVFEVASTVHGKRVVNARGDEYDTVGDLSNFDYYASGGVPDRGTLFWAGESGAEVVANANGRTEVLNQGQLADALASANSGTVSATYAIGQAIVSAINNKDTATYLDGVKMSREINKNLQRINHYADAGAIV